MLSVVAILARSTRNPTAEANPIDGADGDVVAARVIPYSIWGNAAVRAVRWLWSLNEACAASGCFGVVAVAHRSTGSRPNDSR
jgi:hypothetical protein